jgi:cytochrome c biogenesis protein CcdA
MVDPVLVGLAFSAGSAAFLNPCGFAMLPGYVGYALGAASVSTRPWLWGALLGGAASAGFILVFVAAGGALSIAGNALIGGFPWAAIAIGVLVSVVGVAMALGMHLSVPLPSLVKSSPAGESGKPFSFFLYGTAYAVASLSCTLPIFLAVVGWAVTSGSGLDGVVIFLAYAGGMGVVMVALTVAIALAQETLVQSLRRAMPHVQRGAGAVLAVAGGYIVYYQLFLGGYIRP